MGGLKDKLRALEGGAVAIKKPEPVRPHREVERFVPGRVVENEGGRCFVSRHEFSGSDCHGQAALNALTQFAPYIFSRVGKESALAQANLSRAVFFDTETTGLAGGAGTVPFMVGLGFFEDDRFVVEQYFMRDYHEERALLHSVTRRLQNADALVSYNGKGYDLNLLAARWTLARMKNPVAETPHLDLLFAARRLWRRRLADCSLTNIEREILHFHRQGDVPGFEIPGRYFSYLRTRDAEPLKPVFTHNRWDILALAALAGVTGAMYARPDTVSHPLDLMSLGAALDKLGHFEEAAQCYRKALDFPLEREEKEDVLTRLGFAWKRCGRWDKAVQVWTYMTTRSLSHIMPYEELAKFYEHHARDFARALETVQNALKRLDLLEQLHGRTAWTNDRSDLEWRRDRLEGKMPKMS